MLKNVRCSKAKQQQTTNHKPQTQSFVIKVRRSFQKFIAFQYVTGKHIYHRNMLAVAGSIIGLHDLPHDGFEGLIVININISRFFNGGFFIGFFVDFFL